MTLDGWIQAVTVGAALALGVACHRETAAANPPPAALPAVTVGADSRVAIQVDGEGYHPAMIHAAPGRTLTLVFTRTTDETCGQRVRFPTLNMERELPLNHPVEIAVTVPPSGGLGFTCGMGMYQGSIVAR